MAWEVPVCAREDSREQRGASGVLLCFKRERLGVAETDGESQNFREVASWNGGGLCGGDGAAEA